MNANPTTSHNPILAQPRPQTASLLRSQGALGADFGDLLAEHGRAPDGPDPTPVESDESDASGDEPAQDEADAPDPGHATDGTDAEPETASGHADIAGVPVGTNTIARELTHAASVDLAAMAQEEMIRPKDPDKYPGRDGELLSQTVRDPRLSKTDGAGPGVPDSMADRAVGDRNAPNAGPQGSAKPPTLEPAPVSRTPEPAGAEPAGAARSGEASRHAPAALPTPPASRPDGPSPAELAGRVARLERLAGSAEAVRGAVAGVERAGTARAHADPRAGQTGANQPHTRSETGQRVLNAVQRGLASMLTQGGGRMTVVLRPEQLGEVRVRMETRQGSVRATLGASTDAARRTLESGIDTLRAALESRGVRVESIEIERTESHASDRPGAEADPEHRRREGRGRAPGDQARVRAGTDDRQIAPDPTEARGIWTELGIDAVA